MKARYRESVLRMARSSVICRSAAAALIALLLGLRLLGAMGYMPAFEHGSMTIIVCPDADVDTPLAIDVAHHHHGQSKHKHAVCPYASASSLGALGTDVAALVGVLIFVAALLLLGRTFRFLERNRVRERPPSRAPPLPA
jgi:hypothetical protein